MRTQQSANIEPANIEPANVATTTKITAATGQATENDEPQDDFDFEELQRNSKKMHRYAQQTENSKQRDDSSSPEESTSATVSRSCTDAPACSEHRNEGAQNES